MRVMVREMMMRSPYLGEGEGMVIRWSPSPRGEGIKRNRPLVRTASSHHSPHSHFRPEGVHSGVPDGDLDLGG